MTRPLTDTLCTQCGLCCDGTLFADVELVSPAEVVRLENMRLEVDEGDQATGLLSQPCAALRGRRCSIYAHRPTCCRVFECHLLQNAQRGTVTVERALDHIGHARDQIQHIKDLLGRLGNRDHRLPVKERCAEALAVESGTSAEIQYRAELGAAIATLEKTIWNTFLGSGRQR